MTPTRLFTIPLSAAVLMSACGAEEPSLDPLEEQDTHAAYSKNGLPLNGLSANGLSANGLSANGLSANGLSANGLSANGLAPGSFSTWFNNYSTSDVATHDLHVMIMKYLVNCALGAGSSTSFKCKSGHTHTWSGSLGLATGWYSAAPTQADREWVSACMMAHVNSLSNITETNSVRISVRSGGISALTVAAGSAEATEFPVEEGHFFGDLFQSPMVKGAGFSFPRVDSLSYRCAGLLGRNCGDRGELCEMDDTGYSCTQTPGDINGWKSCTGDSKTWTRIVTVFLPRIIEAEGVIGATAPSPILSGTARMAACSDCSRAAMVTNVSGGEGNAVQFSFSASSSGSHKLRVFHSNRSGKTKNCQLRINNGTAATYAFPPGQSVALLDIPVTIPAGTSTFKLFAASGQSCPDLDAAMLSPN